MQLVAGYLLDANSLEGKDVSEEHKLNLQHNLSDAIALLPKLTTGIDVNLRFHDIRGFEVCGARVWGVADFAQGVWIAA